jgi:transposase
VQVRALLPDQQSLRLEEIEHNKENQRVIIRVQSVSKTCACPKCKSLSGRVHSRYQRKLTDLPWQGLFVHMAWITRRFFCDVEECSQKIFTERLAAVAAPYSRRTERLSLAIRCIAFACSGEPGARLAERLGMQISADSLLREIRKSFKVQDSTPRALGVDDWAFCKGQTYGTLLCDLESGRAVELLSDRDADSFAVWLENHKGVEIISRDRGDIYRKGATNGAPDALQVADRFHLMKNLRDAFARFLDGQSQQIRSAVKQFDQAVSTDAKPELEPDKPPIETKAQKQTAARRDRRLAIYNQVVELHRQGKSARSIAKQMGIHRSTVRLYLGPIAFRSERLETIQGRLIRSRITCGNAGSRVVVMLQHYGKKSRSKASRGPTTAYVVLWVGGRSLQAHRAAKRPIARLVYRRIKRHGCCSNMNTSSPLKKLN